MPHFDIIKETHPSDSYRVQAVIGAFDLDYEGADNTKRLYKPHNIFLCLCRIGGKRADKPE
jgi:hypothetical protein